ncbi:MAG: hypothetical protein PHY64_04500 [Eubacteriales bacterium]|nr:hypothetical protein [Eubacteriales bacterium]
MVKKIMVILLILSLLIPAAALGETTALPFGLALGMDIPATKAAFAADATLAAQEPEELVNDSAVEYDFTDVAIPGTDMTAYNFSVQIDQNNSQRADRLTMLTFDVEPGDNSIATFRTLLSAMTASLGAPDSDPFDENGVAQYVEWGTLSASWTAEDVRVSLSLSRMYSDSINILYSSRLNYDEADLAE